MRLIDADELKGRTTNCDEEGYRIWHEWDIDNAPTVITNSVYEAYCALSDEEFEHSDSFWIITPKGKKINFVKDRPHGEWLVLVDEDNIQTCKCSICGRMVDIACHEFDKFPYCHCGAYMSGDRE